MDDETYMSSVMADKIPIRIEMNRNISKAELPVAQKLWDEEKKEVNERVAFGREMLRKRRQEAIDNFVALRDKEKRKNQNNQRRKINSKKRYRNPKIF